MWRSEELRRCLKRSYLCLVSLCSSLHIIDLDAWMQHVADTSTHTDMMDAACDSALQNGVRRTSHSAKTAVHLEENRL